MRRDLRRDGRRVETGGQDRSATVTRAEFVKAHLIRFPIPARPESGVMEMDLIVASPVAWASRPESTRGDWQTARADADLVVAYRAVL